MTSRWTNRMNLIIDSSRKSLREFRHHHIHKKRAFRYIELLELQNGWKLSLQMKKEADDYAIDVFGKKEYAPWLYFYSVFRGEFKDGWIPLNYYSAYVLPDYALTRVSEMKTFSKVVLKTDKLPDIAYYLDGRFYDKNYSVITISELHSMVENNYGKVFVKRDHSLRGLDVHKLGPEKIRESVFQQIGNCVIQYPVQQHPFFAEMHPFSTATLRIVTVKNLEGQVEDRASLLKIGVNENEWYQSSNCVWVGIINKTGELDSNGYTPNYKQISKHPTSKVLFETKIVPNYSDAVEICTKLHATIPHFPIIGWDVAIDHRNQIKVLEWNAGIPHPAIEFIEPVLGPCFSGLGWEDLSK